MDDERNDERHPPHPTTVLDMSTINNAYWLAFKEKVYKNNNLYVSDSGAKIPYLEPEIARLVTIINQCHWFSTGFSCQGHSSRHKDAWGIIPTPPDRDFEETAFVGMVWEGDTDLMFDMLKALSVKLKSKELPIRLEITPWFGVGAPNGITVSLRWEDADSLEGLPMLEQWFLEHAGGEPDWDFVDFVHEVSLPVWYKNGVKKGAVMNKRVDHIKARKLLLEISSKAQEYALLLTEHGSVSRVSTITADEIDKDLVDMKITFVSSMCELCKEVDSLVALS